MKTNNSLFKKHLVRDYLILMVLFQASDLFMLIYEHKTVWFIHALVKAILIAVGISAIIAYRKEKARK